MWIIKEGMCDESRLVVLHDCCCRMLQSIVVSFEFKVSLTCKFAFAKFACVFVTIKLFFALFVDAVY